MSAANQVSDVTESTVAEVLDHMSDAARAMGVSTSAVLAGATGAILQFLWDCRQPGVCGDDIVAMLEQAAGKIMPNIERSHLRSIN